MIKVRSNKDKLEIYEETNKVILKNTFIAVLLTLSGLPFIYIGCLKNDWFFCGGGILFSCLGVLFCYEVLKTYKKLKEY